MAGLAVRGSVTVAGRAERARDKAAYEEVSVFATAEEAAAKARTRNLGDYIAELEVPDETPMSSKGGHRGLIATTPSQLLGMVRNVQSVDEV
jgi:hypothetical protein